MYKLIVENDGINKKLDSISDTGDRELVSKHRNSIDELIQELYQYIVHSYSSGTNYYKNIASRTLKARFGNDYKQVLDILNRYSIIEVNNKYSDGRQAKNKKAFTKSFRVAPLTLEGTVFRKNKSYVPETSTNKELRQCQKTLDKLCVRMDEAEAFLNSETFRYIAIEKHASMTEQDIWYKIFQNRYLLNVVNFGLSGMTVDEYSNRIHSPVTRLNSNLRGFLYLKKGVVETELCNVDISCAQFTFLSSMLKPSFYSKEQSINIYTINKLNNGDRIFDSKQISLLSEFISNNYRNPDILKFNHIISEEDIYDYMGRIIGEKRKITKGVALKCLFDEVRSTSPDREYTDIEFIFRQEFYKEFPTIMDFIRLINTFNSKVEEDSYKLLSRLLQRIEVKVLLKVIAHCRRNNTDVLTIHDSILINKALGKDYAVLMKRMIYDCLDTNVKIKIEINEIPNADYVLNDQITKLFEEVENSQDEGRGLSRRGAVKELNDCHERFGISKFGYLELNIEYIKQVLSWKSACVYDTLTIAQYAAHNPQVMAWDEMMSDEMKRYRTLYTKAITDKEFYPMISKRNTLF